MAASAAHSPKVSSTFLPYMTPFLLAAAVAIMVPCALVVLSFVRRKAVLATLILAQLLLGAAIAYIAVTTKPAPPDPFGPGDNVQTDRGLQVLDQAVDIVTVAPLLVIALLVGPKSSRAYYGFGSGRSARPVAGGEAGDERDPQR